MNLLKIAWGNLRIRPLSTLLSVILLAFGVGIISLLLLIEKQLSEQFNRNIRDIDMVLGYKGSPMQLILANIYHVDAPTGNIRVADAQKIIRHPMVKKAIPLAYGDNYQKFRIVGTTFDYPRHYNVDLADGHSFEEPFQVVVGANVAAETGLRLGDTFVSTHGLVQEENEEEDGHAHDQEFRVVGIYERSGTAIDNLILTPVESVWLIHAHEEDHSHAEADTASHTHAHDHTHEHAHHHVPEIDPMTQEMTAYLIIKRSAMAQILLPNLVKDTDMQLAVPAIEVNRLSQDFGLGMDALKAIAVLIMFLSFVSVFVSLYNSLKERRYELALMRTMGGGAAKLFALILLEGLLLALMGYACGLMLSRLGLAWLSSQIRQSFHYSIAQWQPEPAEWYVLAVTLLVGIVASLLPAWRAFRMDISKTLSDA
ncbi:MAG: ABC transporter permease [Flavobacteriales bacterium]